MVYKNIRNPDDLFRFFGKIIKYRPLGTTSLEGDCYSVPSTNNRGKKVYAYVSAYSTLMQNGRMGVKVERFIKKGEEPINFYVMYDKLSEYGIKMRKAGKQDKEKIDKRLKRGTHGFENHKDLPSHYPIHPDYEAPIEPIFGMDMHWNKSVKIYPFFLYPAVDGTYVPIKNLSDKAKKEVDFLSKLASYRVI